MIADIKNLHAKKAVSLSKSVLAALWRLKQASREAIFSHKYVKSLCLDKNKSTHRSCISRLCKKKFISKDREFNNIIALTEEGEKPALFALIDTELNLVKKDDQRWDGGWRLVFFDIPEKKREYRDYLRKVLKAVGFREFQKSIWAYPYPVPGFLRELILYRDIKPHIKFITTNSIDDDSDLRKTFGLPARLQRFLRLK